MSKKPDFTDLMAKGAEFFQCGRHMHARGMRDVLEEARVIVAALKADGKTFEQLVEWCRAGGHDSTDTDPFLAKVKALWEVAP